MFVSAPMLLVGLAAIAAVGSLLGWLLEPGRARRLHALKERGSAAMLAPSPALSCGGRLGRGFYRVWSSEAEPPPAREGCSSETAAP